MIAPLVLLVSLRALLAPPRATSGDGDRPRYATGVVVLVAALGSTLLALRDAPIGFDDRQLGARAARRARPRASRSSSSASTASPATTCARRWPARPAGYVPRGDRRAAGEAWQQGLAADFDTLDAGQLDKFDYAITTAAAYDSTPPPNFEQVARDGDYVLWKRQGETPRSSRARRARAATRGATARPAHAARRRAGGEATVLAMSRRSRRTTSGSRRRRRSPRRGPGARLGGAGDGDGELSLAAATAPTSSRCSTTRRCRSRWSRRRGGRRAAGLARRHVPEWGRARRVLAGG